VSGADMVSLSGNLLTKVFEGPYANARMWCDEMRREVEQRGRTLDMLYFFYTTWLIASNSPKLSGWVISLEFYTRRAALNAFVPRARTCRIRQVGGPKYSVRFPSTASDSELHVGVSRISSSVRDPRCECSNA
jgi:hydrolase family protein